MRISLLEHREDFYEILSKTLFDYIVDQDLDFSGEQIFFVNKYLNFIATRDLPTVAFKNLVREYDTSIVKWKRPIQKLYVRIAVSHRFRALLSHKLVKLPDIFSRFLIMGGNHRLRLFTGDCDSSYIILKNQESPRFLINEIELKERLRLSYAPRIINKGNNWIQETYFEGTPVNRLVCDAERSRILSDVLNMHIQELLTPTLYTESQDEFFKKKKNEILRVIQRPNLIIDEDTVEEIANTIDLIERNLPTDEIPMAWSHGDFQMANILVSEKEVNVIDWEAADKRFYFYDIFVLMGEFRVHGDLQRGLIELRSKIERFPVNVKLPERWEAILALEELLYCIHENCSLNFYFPGKSVKKMCFAIKSVLIS